VDATDGAEKQQPLGKIMGKSLNVSLLAIIMLVTFSATARCSDWKFYGAAQTALKGTLFSFYDADGIRKSGQLVKVWIKAISSDEIIKLAEDKGLSETINNKARARSEDGYITPFSGIIIGTTADSNFSFIRLEETAKVIPSDIFKALYEINCHEKQLKQLKLTAISNGKLTTIPETELGGWDHIPPDSSSETLAKMLCPVK
jgi:hypothetical protein